ncbi:MAG: helix-turn-helix domain-containing protein [Armatimonadetes bacterium]|nr:helix-turn-helix domain-containing protein [Armatimonadota bacterium]
MQSIQAIRRALDVLEILAREPDVPQPLGEIAAQAELNAATCARILQTLVAAGYVEQVAPRKGYLLGPMAYALGARGPYRKDLVRAAEPLLTALAQAVQETVLLAALRRGRRVLLCQVEGDQTVQVRSDRLQCYDPYQSATGRLLLAYLPEEELEEFLRQQGLPGAAWPEANTEADLREALARIAEAGHLIRVTEAHVVGIAYPVWSRNTVVAALGLYLPEHRFAGAHRERILSAMADTADTLSARVSVSRLA